MTADFGQRFYLRHQTFIPVLMVTCILLDITLLLSLFKVVKLGDGNEASDNNMNLIMLFDVSVYSFCILLLFLILAQINKTYETHIHLLQ